MKFKERIKFLFRLFTKKPKKVKRKRVSQYPEKLLTEKALTYITKTEMQTVEIKIGHQRLSEYLRNLIRADLKGER